MTTNKPPIFSNRVINGVAVLVAVVWAVSFIADILVADYSPSPFIHLALMSVLGGIVGNSFIKGGKSNGE